MSLDDPAYTVQQERGQWIKPPLDIYAQRKIAAAPDCIVAWWLGAAFMYEIEAQTLLSDGYYDELCRDIDARWDEIAHPHKHLISRAYLGTSTASYLRREDYPSIVVHAAWRLMREGGFLPAEQIGPSGSQAQVRAGSSDPPPGQQNEGASRVRPKSAGQSARSLSTYHVPLARVSARPVGGQVRGADDAAPLPRAHCPPVRWRRTEQARWPPEGHRLAVHADGRGRRRGALATSRYWRHGEFHQTPNVKLGRSSWAL